MREPSPFKWRLEIEIILLCMRWYVRYARSYRDLEERMRERGLHVDHMTIDRWVQRYAPEREKRCCPHLNSTNASWRVDETSVAAAHPLSQRFLKHFPQIFCQMPAVQHLLSLWSALGRACEEAGTAISANHLHTRMRA